MKWLLILTLLSGLASSSAQSSSSGLKKSVQAYSGTVWTTIAFQLPNGKTNIVTRRTEVSRDATGNWRSEVHRPTKGLQQDTSGPLDHVFTGSNAAQSFTPSQSNGETLIDDQDLGTRNFSGLPATGRRRVFQSVGRQPQATHTFETWFCPTLGTFVHIESRNFDGSTMVSDFSNLQLGNSVSQQTP
jgi:outer membrane lipoprotein-sorting protein